MKCRLSSLVIFGALTVFLVGACSSSPCKRACRKIDRCVEEALGDGGGGGDTSPLPVGKPSCDFSAKCTPLEACQADCLNEASCEAVLGQDTTGRKAIFNCTVQCATEHADQGITVPDGGPHQDLSQDVYTWPKSDGNPVYYDKGTIFPDLSSGVAVGKFCNNLTTRSGDFTAYLKLGSGSSQITLSAYTGKCSSSLGATCTPLPLGSSMPIEITDGSQTLSTGNLSAPIQAGEQWVLLLTMDSSKTDVELQGGPLPSGTTCQSLDPFANP